MQTTFCGMTAAEILEMQEWFYAIKPLTKTGEFQLVLARARREKALQDAEEANARARAADLEIKDIVIRKGRDAGQ